MSGTVIILFLLFLLIFSLLSFNITKENLDGVECNNQWDENTNCYSYVMGNNTLRSWDEQQPGYSNNFPEMDNDDVTCENIEHRFMSDNKKIYKVDNCDTTCSENNRKIFLSVDPTKDYHFYREDNKGEWSYKEGSSKPRCGLPDPWKMERQIGEYNYKDACGCYCVPI